MVKLHLPDHILVRRVQKGDKFAFDLLVIKYQYRILSLVGSYISDFQEAQDVAQEAFMRAYKSLDRFRGDSSFYTWIYRIAINTAKNHYISNKRKLINSDIDIHDSEFSENSSVLSTLETPTRHLLCSEMKQTILSVVSSLPKELKIVVMLREFKGLKYEEIAEIIDRPTGTVRSRLFRARELIDKAIEPLLNSDE